MKINTIHLILLILLCGFFMNSKAQTSNRELEPVDMVSLGIGLGLDLGGIGGNLTVYPQRNLGLFWGAGYAFAGLGYNVGIKIRSVSDNPNVRACPFIMAMYGYNTAIAVKGNKGLNNFFYGPTFGIGFDNRIRKNGKGFLSFALLVPIRKSEVWDYIGDINYKPGVDVDKFLWPIAFSVSFRIKAY